MGNGTALSLALIVFVAAMALGSAAAKRAGQAAGGVIMALGFIGALAFIGFGMA